MSGRKQRYDDNYRANESYSDVSSDEEGCCLCITRSFVFYSNVALLILGLAAMGYSIYVWFAPGNEWAGDSLALKFTIFASFLVIVALIGVTGTWDPVEQCDLVVYIILLVSIIAAQIAFVVYAATNMEDWEDYMEDIWKDWSDARKDKVMSVYDCGLYQTSYNVTVGNVTINKETADVSNCVDNSETDRCFEDCYLVVVDAIKTVGALTSTFLIIFALLEIMLLISSCILCCNPYEDYSESEEGERPRRQQPRRNHAYGQPSYPPKQQQVYGRGSAQRVGQAYGRPDMNQGYGQRGRHVQSRGMEVY